MAKQKFHPSVQKVVMARTLLSMWPEIDKQVSRLHNKVYNTAILSAENHKMICHQIVDKIIDTLVLKEILLDVKDKVENLVASLPTKYRQVVRSYFLHRLSSGEIKEELLVTERTVHRIINDGVEQFARGMLHEGINTFTFNDLVRRSAWVRRVAYPNTKA